MQHCDKVLVSTTDILDTAREYTVDAEYLPSPVDTTIFYPKRSKQQGEKLRVLLASSCDWRLKGTEKAINALSKVKEDVEVSVIHYGKDFYKTMALARSLGLHVNVLPKTSHANMREYYWNADVVMDQFEFGVMGMISLEAIACDRPILTDVSSKYDFYKEFPLKDVKAVGEIVESFQETPSKLWRTEYNYLRQHHEPEKVVKRTNDICGELLSD